MHFANVDLISNHRLRSANCNMASLRFIFTGDLESTVNESGSENDQVDRADCSSSTCLFSYKEEIKSESPHPWDEGKSEVVRLLPSESSFFSPSALPNFSSLQDWLASLDKVGYFWIYRMPCVFPSISEVVYIFNRLNATVPRKALVLWGHYR